MYDLYRDTEGSLTYIKTVFEKKVFLSMLEESIIWKCDIIAIKMEEKHVVKINYNYFHDKFYIKRIGSYEGL